MSANGISSLIVLSVCLFTAQVVVAADEQMGLAASDPGQVPTIIEKMEAKAIPAFAGQVMQAAAKMPTSPKRRLEQMRDVAVAFAAAIPAAELPALLAQLVIHTPFQMLPDWVDVFRPPLAEQLKPLDEAAYDKLAADVLKHIGDAGALSDEDKTIFTAFAIVLLARGKDLDESGAFAARLLPLLPASYRDQVAAAVPAALAGNYAPLLGPEAGRMRLVIPQTMPGEHQGTLADVLGGVARQPYLLVHDVNRPAPLAKTEIADRSPEPPSVTTTTPKPVIPQPYKAQF